MQEMHERCLGLIDENKSMKSLIKRLEAVINYHNAAGISKINLDALKADL